MQRAGLGDVLALVGSRRLREDDLLGDVDRQLPAVLGMRLLDIDDIELDAIPIALGDLLQAPGLLAEGRSGIGTEDERDRALSQNIGEPHLLRGLAQVRQLEIGRGVAHGGRVLLAFAGRGSQLLPGLAAQVHPREEIVGQFGKLGYWSSHRSPTSARRALTPGPSP